MNLAMENCKSDAKNLLMNENFFKMHRLINDKASEKFRMRFLDLWNASGNPEWENIPHFGRTFIEDIGSSLYYKSKKIQKQLLESGQINTWDLPLLFASIQSINTYTNTKSSRTDFDELLRIRNKLSHLGSTELGDDEFAKLWSAATNILLKYGLSQGEIDDVLTMKLGTTTEFEDKLNQNLDKIKMLREEGNALFKNGEFKRSIERYSEAMLVENISTTELGILYSNRSAAHLGVKNYSDAKIDARCSVNLRPNWGRGYYRLGCTYDKLEQYDKALYYYNLSLKYDPSNSRCLDCQQGAIHMIAKRNRQEHLDPLTMPVTDADMLAFRERVTGPEMIAVGELLSDKIKKERYLAGDPHYTCTEAHNYLCGLKGYTQNYERAAQLFAKAAKEGSAEGMYNLAKLTSEGKGVQRNMVESFQLFLRAADRPRLMEILPGTGVKTRRIGVMEAQHALGLHFETDGILGRDYHQAYNWYTKALLNGSGPSANNLGLMFSEGKGFTPDLEKAVGYWQISALYGITRAMESLAFHNFYNGRPTRAFKWYTLAVKNKTMNSNLHMIFEKEPPLEQFVAEEFEQTIEEELMAGPMRKYVDLKDYHENIDGMERRRERRRKMLELVQPNAAGGKVQTIVNHRIALNQIKKEKSSESDWTTKQAKLFPTRTPNLLGLKPITLKELDKSIHDKTYDGFAIRLTVIEDAILGLPSVQILAEDENGDIEKVYIYNYQQGPTTQDELGYACAFTVINPYFRLMADRKWGIRVDDPNLLIKHPLMKGQDRCRYCAKIGSTLKCRKCRRVFYCSKSCLEKDETELKHGPIRTIGQPFIICGSAHFIKCFILEIGVGPGGNFDFYPETVKCHLIGNDPNEYFYPTLQENVRKFPQIILDRISSSSAENLIDIPNKSVDAVISTMVLCSVPNVDKTLQEVLRVLKPGGKFFYMEHVIDPEATWWRSLQQILDFLGIWPFLIDDCHSARDTSSKIENAGFGSVDQKRFYLDPVGFWGLYIIKPHIYGVGVKKI